MHIDVSLKESALSHYGYDQILDKRTLLIEKKNNRMYLSYQPQHIQTFILLTKNIIIFKFTIKNVSRCTKL